MVTLSGLANHASESRSNEDPLPDTEDGEKDGDDARGESNVKSSSCSSLATLGLSVEWEVSLATLRGPRGESPGSSFETSSGGGAGRVIRCGNGLAETLSCSIGSPTRWRLIGKIPRPWGGHSGARPGSFEKFGEG